MCTLPGPEAVGCVDRGWLVPSCWHMECLHDTVCSAAGTISSNCGPLVRPFLWVTWVLMCMLEGVYRLLIRQLGLCCNKCMVLRSAVHGVVKCTGCEVW
jgi:hypothetical protein